MGRSGTGCVQKLGVVISKEEVLLGAGEVFSWSKRPDTGKSLMTHQNQCQGRTRCENQGAGCRAVRRQEQRGEFSVVLPWRTLNTASLSD